MDRSRSGRRSRLEDPECLDQLSFGSKSNRRAKSPARKGAYISAIVSKIPSAIPLNQRGVADPWHWHTPQVEDDHSFRATFDHQTIVIPNTRPDCSCPEGSQSYPGRRSLRRECCRLHTQIKASSDPPKSAGFWHPREAVGCCIPRLLPSSSSRQRN